MEFCTVINCMDGRVQLPAINYLQKRFNVKYVDSITEAGANLILSGDRDEPAKYSIIQRLTISIMKHHSVGIAVVGHHDCAGNPASKEEQIAEIRKSIDYLHGKFKDIEIIGLWIDADWGVHELDVES